MSRHWYLDWDGPRPESEVLAAGAAVLEDYEAAERRAAAQSRAAAAADGDSAAAQDGARSERPSHPPVAPPDVASSDQDYLAPEGADYPNVDSNPDDVENIRHGSRMIKRARIDGCWYQ